MIQSHNTIQNTLPDGLHQIIHVLNVMNRQIHGSTGFSRTIEMIQISSRVISARLTRTLLIKRRQIGFKDTSLDFHGSLSCENKTVTSSTSRAAAWASCRRAPLSAPH